MIREAIIKLSHRQNLTFKEMELSMKQMMAGEATPTQIAAFLTASSMKGVSVDELTAAAQVMRQFSTKVKLKKSVIAADTCGTGGDQIGTFNISTVAAFVVAGAGVAVAKHGNRSVSSKCGSADVLEALGAKIELDEEKVKACIETVGIGFMFAPIFHPALKFVQPIRKELGIRTIFNYLGPLCNPASVKSQLLGVCDATMQKEFAEVLRALGTHHVMTVRGFDGLDEITTTAQTKIYDLKGNRIREYIVSPEDFGMKKAKLSDLLAKDKETNVRIAREVLDGKSGPHRDIVCLNAAAALYVADTVASIEAGLELARMTIDSGRAKEKLRSFIEFTNKA